MLAYVCLQYGNFRQPWPIYEPFRIVVVYLRKRDFEKNGFICRRFIFGVRIQLHNDQVKTYVNVIGSSKKVFRDYRAPPKFWETWPPLALLHTNATVSNRTVRTRKRAIAKALHLEGRTTSLQTFWVFRVCLVWCVAKKSSEVKYKVRSTNVVRP